ncbi:MAG: PIN domain-containing protein [Chloroflexota bacterium]
MTTQPYTTDASVWVNSFDRVETGHEISRKFLAEVRRLSVPIILPSLVIVEVASAISRSRGDDEAAQAFASAIAKLPKSTLIEINTSLAKQALKLASTHKLRGADAIYAAVAVQHSCILVSLDNEHLTRLTSILTVQTPTDTLNAM